MHEKPIERSYNFTWDQILATMRGLDLPYWDPPKPLSYEDAVILLKKAQIRSKSAYKDFREREPRLPSSPSDAYGDKWEGWDHFFGTAESKGAWMRDEMVKGRPMASLGQKKGRRR